MIVKGSHHNWPLFKGNKRDFDPQEELQIEIVFRINAKVLPEVKRTHCNGFADLKKI